MTPHDSVPLSQLLSIQAGGRLPLSAALYACNEVAKLVGAEHRKHSSVGGLDVEHIRCRKDGAVLLGGASGAAPDVKADVRAVGVIFYRLLTGKVPAARDIVAPSHFNPGVDSELDAVILAALAPNAAGRPASVQVLEGALEAVFEELELTPSGEGLAEVVKAATRQVPVVPPTPVIVPKPISHRPPPGWCAVNEDEDEDEERVAEAPSWQAQERERKWMVGLTAAMVAVALLWAVWPSPKVSHASIEDTPPARVTARR